MLTGERVTDQTGDQMSDLELLDFDKYRPGRVPSRWEQAAIARGDFWGLSPVTNRQYAVLRDLGITPPATRGEAHRMIGEALA